MLDGFQFSTPDVTRDSLRAHLETHYGLLGHLEGLHGERDLNFCLSGAGNEKYLVRVGSASEPIERVDLQLSALRHIARLDPDCPVPRPVTTLSGSDYAVLDGPLDKHPVYVMTWLPGGVAEQSRGTDFAYSVGQTLGRTSRALKSFFHPAADSFVVWDIRRRHALHEEIQNNLSDEVRVAGEEMFHWARHHLPEILGQCRHQICHGDGHLGNVLQTDGQVTGLVDFGDVGFMPAVQNLAIAVSSFQREYASLAEQSALIAGYVSMDVLDAHELEVLPAFVRFRHITSLAFCDVMLNSSASALAYASHSRN